MTMTLAMILAATLMALGLLFMVVAAVGFVRLPDVFCRLHVTGVLDTLGAPLVLLGAVVLVGWDLVSVKLVLGIAFLFTTSPLVGHLLSGAALHAQRQGKDADQPVETGASASNTATRDEVAA